MCAHADQASTDNERGILIHACSKSNAACGRSDDACSMLSKRTPFDFQGSVLLEPHIAACLHSPYVHLHASHCTIILWGVQHRKLALTGSPLSLESQAWGRKNCLVSSASPPAPSLHSTWQRATTFGCSCQGWTCGISSRASRGPVPHSKAHQLHSPV